ncbi:ABC transporter permease [Herbidospora mongoliensis]|uniref:ABC transporter permease n=1 Tax=Herbidospora mongoliensis TaxID=688067 RepID=UPI00082A3B45|nr:ABC transporter permease [Herbidospora mongoliensis]
MFKDATLVLGYELRGLLRNPIWPLFGILQPILYLAFFAPLLGSTVPGGSDQEVLAMFTPGMMLMIALFGSMFAGFSVMNDTRNGVLERLVVSQIWRPAIILGRVLKDAVALVIQAAIIIAISIALGLRVTLLAALLMLGLMALTGLLAGSFSYALALSIRDENAMSQIVQFLAMPLTLIAGLFLPVSLGPGWLGTIAQFNPLYYAVEAGRSLFRGDLGATTIPLAFAIFVVLCALTLIWSVRSLRRLGT